MNGSNADYAGALKRTLALLAEIDADSCSTD